MDLEQLEIGEIHSSQPLFASNTELPDYFKSSLLMVQTNPVTHVDVGLFCSTMRQLSLQNNSLLPKSFMAVPPHHPVALCWFQSSFY